MRCWGLVVRICNERFKRIRVKYYNICFYSFFRMFFGIEIGGRILFYLFLLFNWFFLYLVVFCCLETLFEEYVVSYLY